MLKNEIGSSTLTIQRKIEKTSFSTSNCLEREMLLLRETFISKIITYPYFNILTNVVCAFHLFPFVIKADLKLKFYA